MTKLKQKLFIVLLFYTGHLSAQFPLEYRVALGSRGVGMGESSIALQPSPLSIYYNPAALGFMQQGGLLVEYSNLYGANLHEAVVAAATPIPLPYGRNKRGGFGVMINFEGFDDSELRAGRTIISSALGLPLHRRLALGANFKVLMNEAELENVGRGSERRSGAGLDLSLHYEWPLPKLGWIQRMDAALAAYDIFNTRLATLVPDSSEIIFDRALRGGAAIYFRDFFPRRSFALRKPALLLQLDDRWHIGGEVTLLNTLILRAGYARDFGGPGESVLSFGCGLDLDRRAGNVKFDYAYLHTNSTLPSRHVFALQMPAFIGPPEIEMIVSPIAPIFSSFYRSYDQAEAAWNNFVAIKNRSAEELIEGKLILEAPFGISLADSPFLKNIKLAPKRNNESPVKSSSATDSVNVHLPLKFISDDIIRTRELFTHSQTFPAKLRFEYKTASNAKLRHVDADITLTIHGKNYLVWGPLELEAAFITPENDHVDTFRRSVTWPAPPASWWQYYQPIYRAAQLYEALSQNNFTYGSDRKLQDFDHVKYPAQLLATEKKLRQGDCDDLVALYCSLLESNDVATALVGTSNHVLMMFDTGIHTSRRAFLPLPDSLLFLFPSYSDSGLAERIWLPVEVTAIGKTPDRAKPFDEAVALGAAIIHETIRSLPENNPPKMLFEVVSTAKAKNKYQAARFDTTFNDAFDPAVERTEKALANLHKTQRDYITALQTKQNGNDETGFAAGLQHAALQAYLDDYEAADAILLQLNQQHLGPDRKYKLFNAQGNLALLHGAQDSLQTEKFFEQAEKFYHAALDSNPNFLQAYLNLMTLDTLRLAANIGNRAQCRQRLDEYEKKVQALYNNKDGPYYATDLSLEQLQGVILPDLTATGRGSPPPRRGTRIPPKPTFTQAVCNYFRNLSNRLTRSDPTISRVKSKRGKGGLEEPRLVELLYWSVG